MRWEDLFADLEGQAESWERAERDAEVADRTRSEVGQLTLMSRLRSNQGREVSLRLTAGASVSGTLLRLGADWLLLGCPHETVVPVVGIATMSDLPWGAVSSAGIEAVGSRLTLSSVFRAFAVDRSRVTVLLSDHSTVSGTPDRVGRDFVDLAVHDADEAPRAITVSRRTTVAYAAISAVTRGRGSWG